MLLRESRQADSDLAGERRRAVEHDQAERSASQQDVGAPGAPVGGTIDASHAVTAVTGATARVTATASAAMQAAANRSDVVRMTTRLAAVAGRCRGAGAHRYSVPCLLPVQIGGDTRRATCSARLPH